MFKVKWHSECGNLIQIPKEGLEFAWVSEDYQQVHQFLWCKDFLHDVIFSHLNSRYIDFYGFEYNPGVDPPPCLKNTRMAITNWMDADFGEKVKTKLKPFLHSIETRLKMKKTTFRKCCKVPFRYKRAGIYLLDSDPRWMISPPMVSMLSLLVRIGMVHRPDNTFGMTLRDIRDGIIYPYYPTIAYNKEGKPFDTDKQLMLWCYETIQRVIMEGDEKIFGTDIRRNYPAGNAIGERTSIDMIHNRCGLKSFARGITKVEFPHWHEVRS